MTAIPFTKVVGAGNDFIIIDARRRRFPALARRWPEVARGFCDRHAGIGADGLLVLQPSRGADARMRVFNPDGSEAGMCGNGARCVARYLAAGRGARQAAIDTAAGRITASVRGEQVAMRMTDPSELNAEMSVSIGGKPVRLGFVNTGVPHAVVAVPSVDQVDVAGLGRALRSHEAFGPRGTNVNFAEEEGTGQVRLRTFERGVEAETLACGTGAAAAAVIYGLTRMQPTANGRPAARRVEVRVRSGDRLSVSFTLTKRPGLKVTDLVLEGPARIVCTGTAAWPPRSRD